MGNLCSKSSNPTDPADTDHFATPGRTLGSSSSPRPTQSANPTASLPPNVHTTTTTPTPAPASAPTPAPRSPAAQAREAAARAAEERAKPNASGGKLSAALEAQKRQTTNQILSGGSEEERRRREVDGLKGVREFN